MTEGIGTFLFICILFFFKADAIGRKIAVWGIALGLCVAFATSVEFGIGLLVAPLAVLAIIIGSIVSFIR